MRDNERIVVHIDRVVFFHTYRDNTVSGSIDGARGARVTERTSFGSDRPTRFQRLDIYHLFRYFTTVLIQHLMISLFRKRELNRTRLTGQRTERITLFLRREGITRQVRAIVIGLGTHNDIAVTDIGRIGRFETGCSFLPSSAVLLDLTDGIVTKGETEGIDDIDIVSSCILHLDRTVTTAYDMMVPVMVGRLVLRAIACV